MTTLNISGYKLFLDPVTLSPTGAELVSLSLFYNGDLDEISYSLIADSFVGNYPEIQLSQVSTYFELSDGGNINAAADAMATVDWQLSGDDKTTTFLTIVLDNGTAAYLFNLGGDELNVDDPAISAAFLATGSNFRVPTSPLAPGDNLLAAVDAPSALPNVTVTEDDSYESWLGNESILGGSGNDTYTDLGGYDTLVYQFLDERVEINTLKGFVKKGANGRDSIDGFEDFVGTDFNDIIVGEDSEGGNFLYGRAGTDVLRGNGGEDYIEGGADADRIFGGNDNDILAGDGGDDFMLGGQGIDDMSGGSGLDVLKGGSENDLMSGGDDDDRMFGNRGKDTMDGDDGADRLFGGSSADILYGGNGDDALRGGAGRDTLSGEAGDDNLYGGSDNDIFVFLDDGLMGRDVVKDWVAGEDVLDFTDFELVNFAMLQSFAVTQGSNLKIDFGTTIEGVKQIVIVEGYSYASFTSDDVLL